MPYAFLNPDGTIRQTVPKLSPFMRVGEGERIVNYNPPAFDPELETVFAVTPVPGTSMDVEFDVVPKEQAVVEEVQMRRKTALVQYHLDTAAQRKKYDNILSAISYATSNHPIYSAEGMAFATWRDACWDKAFEILDAVFAGQQEMPSDSDFLAQLPPAPA